MAGNSVRSVTFMLVKCYLMMMRGVTNVPKKWPFNDNFLCLHFLWFLQYSWNVMHIYQLSFSFWGCSVMLQYSSKWLHSLLIKSWSLHGLYFGHCLVRRKLIYEIYFRVFQLCLLILVDLVFPGNLHSHFWVEPLCLFVWWGYVMAWVRVSTVP